MRAHSSSARSLTKRVFTSFVALAAAIFLLGLFTSPRASAASGNGPPDKVQIIVKFAPGLSENDHASTIAHNGGTEKGRVDKLGMRIIEVSAGAADAVLGKYKGDSNVVRAEKSKGRQTDRAPVDPLYGSQWALPKIGWDQVFGVATPAGTATVAVLDTGINAAHPDLAGNVVAGTSLLDSSNGMTDPNGHGTWVAGIIAARADNGEGIAGVGFAGVRVMPVVVLDADGLGQDADVVQGVVWAADNGADVIVMAFSNPGFSDSLQEAIDYAWGKGVVLVAAAGNDGWSTPSFPAGDRGVVGVAATDENDLPAVFSNEGQSVFMAAPGTNIQTTDGTSGYAGVNGTSSSAAFVAGAAALLKAFDPAATNGIIIGRLARTTDPAGTQVDTGNGRLNLARALADTGTDPIQPAGADPVGAGGPFVGPYVAAATNTTTSVTRTVGSNPSTYGDSLTFVATVTQQSNGALVTSGNVVFRDGNNCSSSPILQAATALNLSGQVSMTISSLSGGSTHTVRACYLGTGGSGFGTSNDAIPQTVKANTTTAITSTGAATVVGQAYSVSYTVTVNAPNSGTPTGSVTVTDGTGGSCTATVAAGNCSLTSTSVGSPKTITATYAGDTNFNGSSGGGSHTVNPANTTTSITNSLAAASIAGQSYVVQYTVAANAPGSGTVTGNVTVSDGTDSCAATVAAGQCSLLSTTSGSKTITASYAATTNFNASTSLGVAHTVLPASFTITAAAGTNGSITPSGAVVVPTTTNQTFTIAADPHYHTAGVVVDGVGQGAISSYTFTNVLANHTISASFAIDTFTVNSSSSGNGAIAPLGSLTVNYGDTAAFTLTPNAGYHILSVTGTCGGSLVANTFTTAPVTGACTVIANFAIDTYTVTPSPGANGTLTPSTPQPVNYGSTTAFTATPDSGYHIDTVSGCGGSLNNSTYTTGAIAGDCTVSATFAVNPPPGMTVKDASVDKNEGQQAVNSGKWTDAFSTSVAVTASIGTINQTGNGNWTWTYNTTDGPAQTQVVTITGDNGAPGGLTSVTFQLNVSNVAPTATFGVDLPTINEGGQVVVSLTGPLDPSSVDTAAGFHYAFACDGSSLAGSTYAGSGTASSTICTYNDNATPTIRARIIDKDNGFTEYTTTVTVNDVAPTATFTVDPTGDQGQVVHVAFSSPVDTAPDLTAGLHYSFDCSGNTAALATTYAAAGASALTTCTFNQPGSFTIVGRVIDKDGLYTDYSASTAISAHADLEVTVTDGQTVQVPGSTVTYTIVVTNHGPDAVTGVGVSDTFPAILTGMTWTCAASSGSACPASGSGDIGTTVDLLNGGTATFTASGSLPSSATGTLSNTASLTVPANVIDSNLANNSATDQSQIDKKTQGTVTVNAPASATYGSPGGTAVASGGNGTGAYVYSSTGSTGCSVNSSTGDITVLNGTGTCSITAKRLGDSEYKDSADSAPAVVAIQKKAASVTPAGAGKMYGDSDPALGGTLSGFLAADGVTATYSRTAGESVGPYTISATLNATGSLANYDITYNTGTFTISTRAITVTADPQTKTYGDSDPALTYKVTSGSLAFSDSFSGALTRDPGNDVGSYAITKGTLSLSSNYVLSYVGANLTITKRSVTVTADAQTKIYGDTDPALTYKITSGGLAYSDAFTGSLSRVAGENVGTYAIQQGTLALNATNYTLTYVGANLEITVRPITVKADAKTKVYGDSDPALTYQITSGSLAFSDAFSGSLTRVAGESVGTYAIQKGSLALNANYNLTYVGASLQITQRPVTITADAKTKVYGDLDPALTYQITSGSLVSGDSFTGVLARNAGENVGSYAITIGTVALNGNYVLTYVGANLAISARPIAITADPKTKVYGNADPALTYQITSGTLVNGDTFSGSLTRVGGENVGSYGILKGSVALSSNYALTYYGANLVITQRPIAITADGNTKVYGNTDPALTFQITSGNLVFGDTFSGSLTRDPGENVGGYAILQGTVALSSNYALSYSGATLVITQRPITITADNKTKFAGNADPVLTFQITSGSLAFSDGFSGSLVRAAGEAAGMYAIGKGTVALNSNYNLTFIPGTFYIVALTITSAPTSPVAIGTNSTLTTTFPNTGNQVTPSCSVNWDDGGTLSTANMTLVGSNWTCAVSRVLPGAGVYSPTVTVTDAGTGTTQGVYQFIVVYDPSAGFVTGGGWLMVGTGSYSANPSLSGKANFGFVSKYQKGANIPTGDTEFQFQVASFNFKSTVYEWLVISGQKAQYKGSGTINGSGDYGFLLTATDGDAPGGPSGPDKFRIKVWNKSTSAIVFDNAMGSSDDIDSANPQAIGGGSIVVHK